MIEGILAQFADVSFAEDIHMLENESIKALSFDQIVQMLKDPNYVTRVFLKDGKLMAYWTVLDTGDTGDLISIAVSARLRRQGLGQAAIEDLFAFAKTKKQWKKLMLEVRKSNLAAIGLYEKAGFVLLGARHRYYQDKEDALIYVRELGG